MPRLPDHSSPDPRAARSAGQALVEFALSAPLLVAFLIGIVGFWLTFHQDRVYSTASQTLAEWVARTGEYTPAMGTAILEVVAGSIGVSTETTYLSIVVIDPETDTAIMSLGEAVPADASGAPVGPSDPGWTGELADIPFGSLVQVDIWSYHQVGVPNTEIGFWSVTDGHTVMVQLRNAP